MTIQIKICGLTSLDDTLDAIELGADLLGFHLYPDAKRLISFENIKKIFNEIPFSIGKVGVFLNQDAHDVIDVATELGLDYLEFIGDEGAEYCNQFGRPYFKSIRPISENDVFGLAEFQAEAFLVETYVQRLIEGTGVTNNWDIARGIKQKYGKIILSGGLDPTNIEMAISSVKPYGINIMEGVESGMGIKDYHKMDELFRKVRALRIDE